MSRYRCQIAHHTAPAQASHAVSFIHVCVRSHCHLVHSVWLLSSSMSLLVGTSGCTCSPTVQVGGGGISCWDYFAVVNFAAGNFAEVAENGVGNSIAYKQGTSKREGAQSANAALSHKVIQKHTTPVQTTKYQRG